MIDREEAGGRIRLADEAYKDWPTEELVTEYSTCWDYAMDEGQTQQIRDEEWAKREGIGLALIARGYTAAQLSNPLIGLNGDAE